MSHKKRSKLRFAAKRDEAPQIPDLPAVAPEIPASPEKRIVEALEAALGAVRDMCEERMAAKLSIARLTGVSRELGELLKVMSVYETREAY